jgi:hypothetical protein
MITTQIRDGNSNGENSLKVNKEGEIGVVVHTHPPIQESLTGLPFRQYFTDDGLSNGDNDMTVNGSTNSVDFWIPAIDSESRFIKTLSVKIAHAGAAFNEFGNLSALTNGVEIEWQSQELGTVTIHDGIKDNLEWYRLSEQVTTTSIIDLTGGGADAIVVQIDFAKLFGNPWGVKLLKASTEKLLLRVRDNLSTITEFNVIGYGTKITD